MNFPAGRLPSTASYARADGLKEFSCGIVDEDLIGAVVADGETFAVLADGETRGILQIRRVNAVANTFFFDPSSRAEMLPSVKRPPELVL